MRYAITVVPRPGSWTTYNRGGYCFDSTRVNVLDEARVNDAMREDPRLLIEPVLETEVGESFWAGQVSDVVMGVAPLPDVPLTEAESGGPLTNAAGDPINDPTDIREPVKCTATTKKGNPCGAWALEGTDRCRQHPHE